MCTKVAVKHQLSLINIGTNIDVLSLRVAAIANDVLSVELWKAMKLGQLVMRITWKYMP